jgi:hypothetical protein
MRDVEVVHKSLDAIMLPPLDPEFCMERRRKRKLYLELIRSKMDPWDHMDAHIFVFGSEPNSVQGLEISEDISEVERTKLLEELRKISNRESAKRSRDKKLFYKQMLLEKLASSNSPTSPSSLDSSNAFFPGNSFFLAPDNASSASSFSATISNTSASANRNKNKNKRVCARCGPGGRRFFQHPGGNRNRNGSGHGTAHTRHQKCCSPASSVSSVSSQTLSAPPSAASSRSSDADVDVPVEGSSFDFIGTGTGLWFPGGYTAGAAAAVPVIPEDVLEGLFENPAAAEPEGNLDTFEFNLDLLFSETTEWH